MNNTIVYILTRIRPTVLTIQGLIHKSFPVGEIKAEVGVPTSLICCCNQRPKTDTSLLSLFLLHDDDDDDDDDDDGDADEPQIL